MCPRASALPPAERRVSIVRSALLLIAANGTMPTTREIAEEAGIAEGTIFRAFDTKERLVEAVVGEVFCPAPIAVQMRDIDMSLPLRDRLVELVTVLQQRFAEIFGVMTALGLSAPPADFEEHRGCRTSTGHVPVEEQDPADGSEWGDSADRLRQFVEPDADQLSCTADELTQYLRLFTFSASHPDISGGQILAPETIVDVVLDGVRASATRIPTRSRKAR
ncbi:MAG: helix-turn-helix domain-containing protein [Lapillicoccus sp.]